MNVLILSGGGFQGHTLLKELNAIQGVNTFIVDIYKENVTRYFTANYFTFVRIDHPEFKERLIRFCKDNEINVVFPSTVHELPVLAEIKKNNPEFLIASCEIELLAILLDKKTAFDFLAKNNFSIGKLFDIKATNAANFFPIIAKRREGFGGKGIYILKEYSSFEDWKLNMNPDEFVLQEYLEDHIEYSCDFAIGFSGFVSDIIVRTRLRQSGGFAVVTQLDHRIKIKESVRSLAILLSKNKGCGLFNVQMLAAKDQIIFSDINPRMGTSAILGEANGNNLCAVMLESSGIRHTYPSNEVKSKAVRYLAERFIPAKVADIKTVIFDLDDTLFPQKKWIIGKLELLYEVFQPDIPKAGFISEGLKQLEQGNRSDLIDRLAEVFQFASELKTEMIESYRTLIPKIAIYNDVIPVLMSLRKQNIKIGLLTDNPPESQKQKLVACGLTPYFDSIIFTREAGGEKPYIGSFDVIMKSLSAHATSTAFVGDHLYKDILGAYLAGIKTLCWLPRPGSFFNFDENEFRRIHPSVSFSKFEDLYHISAFIG